MEKVHLSSAGRRGECVPALAASLRSKLFLDFALRSHGQHPDIRWCTYLSEGDSFSFSLIMYLFSGRRLFWILLRVTLFCYDSFMVPHERSFDVTGHVIHD